MPDFLINTFNVLIGNALPALLVLMVVVFVHEMGHFLVARWCGIRVAAFSIGFGRELAGFDDRRGTRWKLSAIPLGGYVGSKGTRTPPACLMRRRWRAYRKASGRASSTLPRCGSVSPWSRPGRSPTSFSPF
jgi:regulator of sigma E protease